MLQGHQNAAGYLAPGRIVAGDKQVRDHVDGFGVGQALTVCLGGTQCSDEIAARILSATCRQPVDIGLQLRDRLRRVGDLFRRHDEEHRAQRLGPFPEHLDIGVRYAEQAADQPRRERRTCRDEISALPHGSDRDGCHVRSRRPQPLDGSRRERARHQRPNATVIVALCREHQLAVPVAEGSVGNTHHVEKGQPDSGEPLIVGQHFEIALAEHDGGAGQDVRGQWSLACRLA